MKILITNDDGIFSSGIYALWEVAKEFGSVYVVAPNSQKSATGHSITISKPIFVDKIKRRNGFEGISVSGSPADCVKFGLKKITEGFGSFSKGDRNNSFKYIFYINL